MYQRVIIETNGPASQKVVSAQLTSEQRFYNVETASCALYWELKKETHRVNNSNDRGIVSFEEKGRNDCGFNTQSPISATIISPQQRIAKLEGDHRLDYCTMQTT